MTGNMDWGSSLAGRASVNDTASAIYFSVIASFESSYNVFKYNIVCKKNQLKLCHFERVVIVLPLGDWPNNNDGAEECYTALEEVACFKEKFFWCF